MTAVFHYDRQGISPESAERTALAARKLRLEAIRRELRSTPLDWRRAELRAQLRELEAKR